MRIEPNNHPRTEITSVLKKTILALFGLVLTVAAHAQPNGEDRVKCHTYEMQEKLFESRPDIKSRAEELQREFELKMRTIRDGDFSRKDGEPYIIPVVFHVVHDFGPENISNEQIIDAVEEMTLDFNAANTDLQWVHEAFAGIAGNVGIEFRLARRDPQDNCTNGVVRTVHPATYSGGENLKEVSPIWDRSKYLNIWVCKNIASGAAGYTYYPSSLAGSFGETNDGIVVRSDYVGGIGTSTPGRRHTLTHEVGHWINLPHVWGSTNEPGLASNCDSDDGVADTPNTIGWTECISSGESCGSLDNVENFMEYSYCSKMFTEGQKTRMLAALNDFVAERSSLWQDDNLMETGVLDADQLCSAQFSSHTRTVCVGETVDFSDQSFWGVTSRSWIFDGGTPASSTAPNPSIQYHTPGEYSVALLVSDSAGNSMSRVETAYISVLDTSRITFPYTESFEAANLETGLDEVPWYDEGNYDVVRWRVTDQAGATGTKSVRAVEPVGFDAKERRSLSSQTFELSGLESLPLITFKYSAAAKTSTADAELRVLISKDCGRTWNLRNTFSGSTLFTAGTVGEGETYVPTQASQWQEATVLPYLDIYLTAEFRMKFEFRSGGANAVYIDDINVVEMPVTAVRNAAEPGTLSVYPNPTSGAVTVSAPNAAWLDEPIRIFDYTGREVLSTIGHAGHGSEATIDCSALRDGVYLIRVGDRTARVVLRR